MSTTLPIVDLAGQEVGQFEVNDSWLEHEKGAQAVHQCVVAHLAARRAGTACTKTRGLVSGGGAKPWRQKGTGRARAGSNRSPVWVGGGTAFGPRPRDYTQKVNKKVRQLALRRAFTGCLEAGKIVVVNELSLAEPRTSLLANVLDIVASGRRHLIILADDANANVKTAGSNLPTALVTTALRVNVYALLRHDRIVITQAALAVLGQRLEA